MRTTVRLAIAVLCPLAVAWAGPALAERRVALAVGINVYDSLPAAEQLKKAVNDARAVGAALKELGFDIAVEENVTRLAFIQAWQRFLNRLKPGDTAALFFAGHGVEVGGLNYLLPRDVPQVVAGQEKLLAGASLRLNELMEDLRERKVRVSLLIVDACRDNPFRDRAGRSVGGARGLTRVEAARGSFVMYSAGEGEEALDRLPGGDADANSVFTRALLPILRTPGLSLQEIAVGVREKVVATAHAAGREQTPAYYDRLVGKLVLKAAAAAVPKTPPGGAADAVRICRDVEGMSNPATLAVLERQYKGTSAGECVTARLRQIALGAKAAESTAAEKKEKELASLKSELEELKAELASKSTQAAAPKPAEDVAKLKATITRLEAEVKQLEGGRTVAPPPAPKAPRQARPNPTKYSLEIWPAGSLNLGQTVTANTPHGRLTCTSQGPPSGGYASRPCRWGK